MPAKPALRTELLFYYLSFLAGAALLVGVATILVASAFAPERTFAMRCGRPGALQKSRLWGVASPRPRLRSVSVTRCYRMR